MLYLTCTSKTPSIRYASHTCWAGTNLSWLLLECCAYERIKEENVMLHRVVSRSGKGHETCNGALLISESLSKYVLSLPLHSPTTGPAACYGTGGTKPVPGECTAGVSTPVPKSAAPCGALYISIVK